MASFGVLQRVALVTKPGQASGKRAGETWGLLHSCCTVVQLHNAHTVAQPRHGDCSLTVAKLKTFL